MYGIGIFASHPAIVYAATVTPVESHDNPSINAAELLAIRKSLTLLASHPPGRYEIVSDSSFALHSIQAGKSNFPKLQFIISEIKELLILRAKAGYDIAFRKVKSHMWVDD